jgi:hypothetical protein
MNVGVRLSDGFEKSFRRLGIARSFAYSIYKSEHSLSDEKVSLIVIFYFKSLRKHLKTLIHNFFQAVL